MPYKEKECIECHNKFIPKSPKSKICEICQNPICIHCEKRFKTTANRIHAQYCSNKCYLAHRWGSSHSQEIVCKYCEKHFIVAISDIANGKKYCSKECANKDRIGSHLNTSNHTLTKLCDWCGKEFTRPLSNFRGKHSFCSHPCSAKWWSEFGLHGEKHPNYINGKGNIYGDNWVSIRDSVLKETDNKCKLCTSSKNIDVHHIIPFKFFHDPQIANRKENLIALCRKCHAKEEWKSRAMLPLFYSAIKNSHYTDQS